MNNKKSYIHIIFYILAKNIKRQNVLWGFIYLFFQDVVYVKGGISDFV